VTTLADLVADLTAPSLQVSGEVTGADEPLTLVIRWIDDDSSVWVGDRVATTWSEWATVTPTAGSYVLDLVGPLRATTAEIAVVGESPITVDLSATVATTLNVAIADRRLVVDATIDDPLITPVWASTVPITVDWFAADTPIRIDELAVSNPFGGPVTSFQLGLDVPTGATRAELRAVYDLGGPLPGGDQAGPTFGLDVDLPATGTTTTTWTLAPTTLELTGELLGDAETWWTTPFTTTVTAFDADGPIGTIETFEQPRGTAAVTTEIYLPTGTTRVEVTSDLLLAPVVLEAVQVGPNQVELGPLSAPPSRVIELTGSITRDGRTVVPTPEIRVRVRGASTGSELGSPWEAASPEITLLPTVEINPLDADGSFWAVVSVPGATRFLDVEVLVDGIAAGSPTRLDVSTGDPAPLDIELTS
jgi:hypothetical protein